MLKTNAKDTELQEEVDKSAVIMCRSSTLTRLGKEKKERYTNKNRNINKLCRLAKHEPPQIC